MSGTFALEAQLNGVVKEYLDFYGFESTLETFNQECLQRGKTIVDFDKKNNSNQKINSIMNEMISLFLQGQRKEFFRRWIESVPFDLINSDLSAQKLELELNIHFAIYPFRKPSKLDKQNPKESMMAFKEYIENKGRVLCQTKEFLPYFGLPYHQNPQDGFPELFTEAWIAELQNKLEEFLKNSLKLQTQPRLVEIYSQPNESDQNQIMKLKQQLIESEKRTMAFMRKFNRVQSDYHSLIGITAELVDSLENTINGKPVSNEYIQNICFKLFNTQLKQTIDFSRPGTAGEHIRKSLAYQKIMPEKSDLVKKVNQNQLDFDKIKYDLINQNEKRQISLLQALRWRLTKCDSTEQRQRILTSYITADLFNFRTDKKTTNIIDLLKSSNDTIKQFMARLINTFASLNYGRSYLASSLDLVKNMIFVLRFEKEDSFTRKNLLGALQKLSLRHNLHVSMINENTIDYLVDLLEDNESLSDYSLEYSVALFMNLTLKKLGKNKCIKDHKRILKVLSELLGNSSVEAQNYINGILYSMLSVPEIRLYAREINLVEILRNYTQDGDEYVNKQREVIINKINSDEDVIEIENDDEEDEDDEEDGEIMERELDAGEFVLKQNDDLIGEQLLGSVYSISSNKNNEFVSESTLINKPSTPLNLRQSQLFQTKQFDIPKNPKIVNQSQNLAQSTNKSKKIDTNMNPKSGLSFNKSDLKQSNVFNSKKSNKNNILVLNSNDIKEIEAYEPKYSNVKDSTDAFINRPKVQRTPDQSVIYRRKNSISQSTQSNGSYAPKYSIAEPRPSSANSTRSKNSPNSSTLTQN